MDCMHGVLMHGDSEAGDDHKHEDTYERLQRQDKKREPEGPCQGMDCLHGVLMHGDNEQGVEHMHQEGQIGPEERKQDGPCEGMDCLHGVMMHGDAEQGASHKHEDERKSKPVENKEQEGPCVGMDCMHGVLMHGDSEGGKDHDEEHKKLTVNKHEGKKFGTHDPEAMLHGGDGDHVHDHEVELSEAEKERNKGIPSIESPDGMLHGDMNEMLTLGEAPHHEKKEFDEWNKKPKKSANDAKKEKALLGGFSFPFISDTFINELDLMKRRWLAKFWGSEEDEVAYSEEDRSNKVWEADSQDMRDDVKVVGNTQPLDKNDHHSTKKKDTHKGMHDDSLL